MKKPKLNPANLVSALLMLGAVGLAACGGGSSGGGSASTPTNTVWDQCGGCSNLANGAVILDNVQAQTPDGAVTFWFNVVGAQGSNLAGPKSVIFYAGPATISGNMRVNTASFTWCNMPIGNYQLQPLQPSNFGSGLMYGGAFQAIGPGGFPVRFRVNNAVFYNPVDGLTLGSSSNRANLNLILDSVGGSPCGSMATN